MIYRLRNAWWWVIHRIVPKHRYHVVKLRSLEPGYHDTDSRILASAFDLLSEHAEGLMGDGIKGTQFTDEDLDISEEEGLSVLLEQIEREVNAIALRNWWVIERPKREEEWTSPPDGPEGAPFMWITREMYRDTPEYAAYKKWSEAHWAREDAYRQEDLDKFHELINSLHSYWD